MHFKFQIFVADNNVLGGPEDGKTRSEAAINVINIEPPRLGEIVSSCSRTFSYGIAEH